ncbi:MAG: acetate--CoA ligase family protein [Candidatus Bilamarchaeaceae archaeon]
MPSGMLADFALLKKYGFKLIPYGVAKSEKEAVTLAEDLGYPVVMKIISPDVTHKTDIGGVKLGLKNHIFVKLAYRELMHAASKANAKVDGILVQRMARKGVELIIGCKKDPQFGHMVVLGLGGIYVEIFRDVTARICPITEADVDEMVGELKAHPIIRGARGQKGISIPALKDMLLKTCRMASKEGIQEMDINPVVFDEHGGDIIDVRMTR